MFENRKWQEAGEDCEMTCFRTCVSPYIIRVIKSRKTRWAGHVAYMEAMMDAYNIFLGRPEGKRPLRRPRHRWEDNIRMDLRVGGCGLDASGSGY
jgi:hypothetical protein